MESFDIVKILGVGLSGFGFLLMFLAYKLIQSLVPLPHTNPQVVKTINRYLLICFIMTLVVGSFTFISTYYKNDLIKEQSSIIENNTKALNVLAASNKNIAIADSLSNHPQSQADIDAALKEQQNALDTLGKYVDEQGNPELKQDFNKYKGLAMATSDSLQMENLPPQKIEELKSNVIRYNNALNQISIKVAKNISPVLQNNMKRKN
ncbi:MAG: hypothetical protein JSS67_02210 [Bacteroidetes bacterium]|nr:hypothetical protein [Bacteroidota bacterium]